MTPAFVVSPYSAQWPDIFRGIREELLGVFSPLVVAVEHIGSTSVPGLAAKPVRMRRIRSSGRCLRLLGKVGWAESPASSSNGMLGFSAQPTYGSLRLSRSKRTSPVSVVPTRCQPRRA
ncbi:MAG: hypothetical protein HOP03_08065 [Lysobacter sp.]|nr:hypothetical protein [Lysobacter sp.]